MILYMQNFNSIPHIPRIKLKNTLKSHYHYESVLKIISEKLVKIPELKTNFRLDPQLTLIVCNLLEYMIKDNKKLKINKKNLATRILTDIFELTIEEVEQVGSQIEFLHDNKQIKRANAVIEFGRTVLDFFCLKH
jgi:hypothetical protein